MFFINYQRIYKDLLFSLIFLQQMFKSLIQKPHAHKPNFRFL